MTDDERFMAEAVAEARAAAGHGDVPIGAVVVRDGAIVARGRNRREADLDPTAHAEILARLPLVVFGAPEGKTGAVHSTVDLFDDPRSLHRPRWRTGARREEIERLLSDFFAERRAPREVEG